MAANQGIIGKVWHIRTTGFVTSASLIVTGAYFFAGNTAMSTTIVERGSQKPIFRVKTGANIGQYLGPLDLPVRGGLSTTTLGTNVEVMVYSRMGS